MKHFLLSCAFMALGCQSSTVQSQIRHDERIVVEATSTPSPDLSVLDVQAAPMLPEPNTPVSEDAMVEVPAGIAVIGSTKKDTKRAVKLCKSDPTITKDQCTSNYEHERPQHEVTIERFWIDENEVTVAEYTLCLGEGVCTEPGSSSKHQCAENTFLRGLSNHPVNCVSWYQAATYCRWRNKRLPSSQEWEKAARGTTGQTFPWGEETPTCESAYTPERGGCRAWGTLDGPTAPVGSMPIDRSPYGAMDMAGNVSEWTSTEHSKGYRIIKGGAAESTPSDLRGANSMAGPEEEADSLTGFRCAYSEDEDETEPEAAQQPQLEVDAL